MANSDFFVRVGNPGTATTLAAPGHTIAGSTFNVGSTANWPQTAIFAVDTFDLATGKRVPGSYTEWQGEVTSATTVSNAVLRYGTDQNYPAGSLTRVYIPVASSQVNRLVDGLEVEHGQNGTHDATKIAMLAGAQTFTGAKTFSGAITTTDTGTHSGTNNFTGALQKDGFPVDWWQEIGRTTLTVAGDAISIPSIPAKKYLRIIVDMRATGGNVSGGIRFNNDAGNNYAYRYSVSGGADTAATSANSLIADPASPIATPVMTIYDFINIATEEKIGHGKQVARSTAGAANAPVKLEMVAKWANTANAITRVDLINESTGDYAIGSQLIVLGHD